MASQLLTTCPTVVLPTVLRTEIEIFPAVFLLTLLRVCWGSSCAFASAAALVNSLFVNLLFFCSRCEFHPLRWHSSPRVHLPVLTFFSMRLNFLVIFFWFTARAVQRCRPPVTLDVRGHP